MNILFLTSLYPPHTKGGGEVSTYLIAEGLVRLGHTVTVLTSTADQERKSQDTHEAGVRVLRLPLPLSAKPLFERRHAQKIARAIGASELDFAEYDVVHAHDFRTALVLHELVEQGAVHRHRTIVTSRDYAQICGSPNNLSSTGEPCLDCSSLSCIIRNQAVVEAPLLRRPFRIWQYWFNIEYRRSAFKSFPTQIFISNAQKSEISAIQDLSEQQTNVIYNPVADSYHATKPSTVQGQTILYTGRVQHYKGVETLLRAFRELSETHPDAQLHIVGDGDQRRSYEQEVARWGLQYKVRFTSHVAYERVAALYDDAAVVVAPHLWVEPFGRTVVEAMARGRVVVAADRGGPAEIIQNQKTGFLFSVGDHEDLAQTLRDVLSMGELRRREIQSSARAWTQRNLSQENICQQHEASYATVIDT